MTAPQRRVGLHRDVHFELDTLTRIRATCVWLEAHLPDLHDLAYAPNSGAGEDRVQTSGERDLSDDLGRACGAPPHQTTDKPSNASDDDEGPPTPTWRRPADDHAHR